MQLSIGRIAILCAALASGCGGGGTDAPAPMPTAAALSITDPSSGYGSVAVGSSLDRDFTVSNSGEQASGALGTTITGLDAARFTRITGFGGDCPAGALAGNSNCIVRVRFTPDSRGVKQATLNVTAAPGGAPTGALTGTGIAPVLTGDDADSAHDFGNVATGQSSSTKVWTITNSGDASTTATPAISKSGTHAADFTNTTTCTAALGPGQSCTVTITFSPAANGTRTASVTANAGGPSLSLAVSGTGTSPYHLSVTVTGSGSVNSSDGMISSCSASGGTCSVDYPNPASVTLTATTSDASEAYFQDWNSASCDGPVKTCSESVNAVKTVVASFGSYSSSGNLMFVTSTVHTGNLGGLAGADAICQARASAAGIGGGTYRAWLSSSTVDAKARLGANRGWRRMDGSILADDLASSTIPNLLNSVRYDENGATISPNFAYFTGSGVSGTYGGSSCTDWTATTGNGQTADSRLGVSGWAYSGIASCASQAHLLCVMTKNSASIALPPAPAGAKLIVMSNTVFTPNATVSPDQHCISQAGSGYKALVGYTTGAASTALDAATTYVRPDGVVIGTGAELMAITTGTYLRSGIFQRADGLYINTGMLLGPSSLTSVGTASNTCANWTSTATGTPAAGTSNQTTGYAFFGYLLNCNSGGNLYCVQQ